MTSKTKIFFALYLFSAEVCLMPSAILSYSLKEGLKHAMNIFRYNSILVLETVFATHCSTLSLAGSHFIFLKCDGLIQDLVIKFAKKEHISFDLFEVCFLTFSSKEETTRNINNPNVAELTHCIIFFKTQETGTFFSSIKILV